MLWIVVLSVFIIPGFIAAFYLQSSHSEIAQIGIKTEGIITDKTTKQEYSPGKGGRSSKTIYVVSYQFPLQNGDSFQAARHLEKEVWIPLVIGHKIEIQYDPNDPNHHESSLTNYQDEAEMLFAFSGLLAFLAGLLVLYGLFSSYRQIRKTPEN